MSSRILLSFLSILTLSAAQRDPLKDFCRLFGHQTTVVDRKHYIDGGFVNWAPLSAESTNFTSTWLREGSIDDSDPKTTGAFPPHSLLAKNESAPTVHGGVLWADETNKIIYQYGGEYGNEKPDDFRLWFYDIVYNTWNISSAAVSDIKRAAWGAGAVAQDKALGYYYGGWLTNDSVPGYGSEPTPLQHMLVYDMLESSFRNQSGPDEIPRAEGTMVYLPAGDSGLLVYFGGIQFPYGNTTEAAMPMTEILVYDIGNDRWYQQTATGDETPGDRRRFCAGAAWPDDKSSYNIYLYGGASVGEGVGFGDVWVLSLPSFRWVKYWPHDPEELGDTAPHHSLSCDVIGNSQMIIMGGHFTNHTDECDVPSIHGQHGLDLGKQNSEGKKWAMFNPELKTYRLPSELTETIGGSAEGSATVLEPAEGFNKRDLSVQFSMKYQPGERSPTRALPATTSSAVPSGGVSKAAKIGAAVGGAVGGLLVFAAIGACIMYRRKQADMAEKRSRPELPGTPSHPTLITNLQPGVHYKTASPTIYTITPDSQHSASSPHDREWSPHSQGAAASYPTRSPSGASTLYAAPAPRHPPPPPVPPLPTQHSPHHHHRMESAQSYHHVNSPTQPHEMPTIRSPAAFHERFSRQFSRPRHDLGINGIDPYYAQNPPREMMGDEKRMF